MHIYCCNQSASREIKLSALRLVGKKVTEQGFNKLLVRSMLKGLHAWMHDLPLPHISPKRTTIHSTVREAYYIQNNLGWDNLLCSRFHRSWEADQSAYQASREQAISPMIHGLSRLLRELAEKMWKARNQMKHGTTKNARSKYATERMNVQLDAVYKQENLTFISAQI